MRGVAAEAEVLVVGAGPAGSACAAALAARGRDVLLVDRAVFPRPKPCGECLNPGAVRTLDRLGLLGDVLRTGAVPLLGWMLMSPEGRAVSADFPHAERALGIDRGRMDGALVAAARRRGARLLQGVRVGRIEPGGPREPARAWGIGSDGVEHRLVASVLVGADGLRSVVARGLDVVRRAPRLRKASLTWRIHGTGPSRGRGRLYIGGDRTVGLAPIPGGTARASAWNATLVVDPRRLDRELGREGWELLREGLGALAPDWTEGPAIHAGPWASGPFDWPMSRTVVGRTLLVGDAAGYFDPLTGQGMYRAFRSGELAAEAIDRAFGPAGAGGKGVAVDRTILGRYHRDRARLFVAGRSVQHVVERVVSNPGLRGQTFALLDRVPGIAASLIGLIGDQYAPPAPPRFGERLGSALEVTNGQEDNAYRG